MRFERKMPSDNFGQAPIIASLDTILFVVITWYYL